MLKDAIAVIPSHVPTHSPHNSPLIFSPRSPAYDGIQQAPLLCFPLTIPNLKGLSGAFSAQHPPVSQARSRSPHLRDCTACPSRVSWSWNYKFSGPVQGGRLLVMESSFSQPQPAQQCGGHSLSENGPWLPPTLAHLFSGPSQRTHGADPVLLLVRHPLPPPRPEDPRLLPSTGSKHLYKRKQRCIPGWGVMTSEEGVLMSRGSAADCRCPMEGSAGKHPA